MARRIRKDMDGRTPRWFWAVVFWIKWWAAWVIGRSLWRIEWPWWRIRWCWQYVAPLYWTRWQWAWWQSGNREPDFQGGMDPAASVEVQVLRDLDPGPEEEPL
jgi:hypothetical protein